MDWVAVCPLKCFLKNGENSQSPRPPRPHLCHPSHCLSSSAILLLWLWIKVLSTGLRSSPVYTLSAQRRWGDQREWRKDWVSGVRRRRGGGTKRRLIMKVLQIASRAMQLGEASGASTTLLLPGGWKVKLCVASSTFVCYSCVIAGPPRPIPPALTQFDPRDRKTSSLFKQVHFSFSTCRSSSSYSRP